MNSVAQFIFGRRKSQERVNSWGVVTIFLFLLRPFSHCKRILQDENESLVEL